MLYFNTNMGATLTSDAVPISLAGNGPMLPSEAMNPQEELKQELKEQKKELVEAQRQRKETLKRQIRRAQSRITAAERKRRTRRLILMSSYLEHVPGDDPGQRDRLMKRLDSFLERDRDRELFGLQPRPNPDLLQGE